MIAMSLMEHDASLGRIRGINATWSAMEIRINVYLDVWATCVYMYLISARSNNQDPAAECGLKQPFVCENVRNVWVSWLMPNSDSNFVK